MRELLLLSGCEKFAGESKLSAAPSVVVVGCWTVLVGVVRCKRDARREGAEEEETVFFHE